jgi:hypothetical protein
MYLTMVRSSVLKHIASTYIEQPFPSSNRASTQLTMRSHPVQIVLSLPAWWLCGAFETITDFISVRNATLGRQLH